MLNMIFKISFVQYDRSLTPTKNIVLPNSLLSCFDLLFIVLDQMDPDIDHRISEHVLRMHRYRSSAEDSGIHLYSLLIEYNWNMSSCLIVDMIDQNIL